MKALTPAPPPAAASVEEALRDFIEALGEGDLGGAAACFTREGCMITPDGTAVHGRAAVAGLLAQLIDRGTEIDVSQVVVRRAGDVALLGGRLTLSADGPLGARVFQTCRPTMAMRRVEGRWKIAILAPWAGAAASAG